jgi:hypothetical protein
MAAWQLDQMLAFHEIGPCQSRIQAGCIATAVRSQQAHVVLCDEAAAVVIGMATRVVILDSQS